MGAKNEHVTHDLDVRGLVPKQNSCHDSKDNGNKNLCVDLELQIRLLLL